MVSLPYAFDALARNWNRPHWWTTVFNSQVVGRVHGLTRANDGVSVLDEEWDALLILDACRYDLFEEYLADTRARTEAADDDADATPSDGHLPDGDGAGGGDVEGDNDGQEIDSERDARHVDGEQRLLGGDLQRRRSRGSGSPEFLRENFAGRDCSEVVYVTANPFVAKVLDDPFHYVDHVWTDGWDDDHDTVLPETVADRARVAARQYPEKRLIVHFMQPHHPFLGDVRLDEDHGIVGARAKTTGEEVPDVKFVWERLREGSVDEDRVWAAYRANLDRVMGVVDGLLDVLPGRVVITADHGNAFGERAWPSPTRVYGHGDRIRIPALVDVPWYVLDPVDRPEERRVAEADAAAGGDDRETDETIVEDRLESLGYR